MDAWDKKRDVMQRYDLTAHMYDMRYAEEQTAKIKAALKKAKVGSKSVVLDVGCGTGVLFPYIAEEAQTVVGIDISKQTLLQAKKLRKELPKVHLIEADADNLPFGSSIFDRVFAMTVIQNTPNPSETLREISRVALSNALMVITGLKKIFSMKAFERLLTQTNLNKIDLEKDGLQCYVAVCVKTFPNALSNVDSEE